ncbi:hypothetical protein GCM10027047_24200 [Rhodococcus aerolatus]
MLLVCHLVLPADPGAADELLARAHRAAALLSAQPGCRGVEVGRAVDDPGHGVLTARFDSVPAYRRSLAPFDVREHVVPLLSLAVEDPGEVPSTFETLLEAVDGSVTVHGSDRDPRGAQGPGRGGRGSAERPIR